MLERPLRYIAVLASAIVLVSFGLFAIDETRSASAESRAAIADQERGARDPEAAARLEAALNRRHSRVRQEIDRANTTLTRPFQGLAADSDSVWFRRGLPSVLALLLFGAGFASSRGSRRGPRVPGAAAATCGTSPAGSESAYR